MKVNIKHDSFAEGLNFIHLCQKTFRKAEGNSLLVRMNSSGCVVINTGVLKHLRRRYARMH